MIHTKKLAMSTPLSLMAIFLGLILTTNSASAFTFTTDFQKGFYWRAFPIKMKKFASTTDSAALNQLVDETVAEWENAIGKDIWEFSPIENSTNYSGNYIRWSDNFGAETGYDPSRTLAITIRYNQGTFFEQTVIVLNGNISYLRQNWGNTLRTTILHEIGHTLGLDHSAEEQAIMYPSIGSITHLQEDDIDGINAVVDETMKRQETGYVSPLSTQTKEKGVAACGSVEDISKGSGTGGSGLTNFFGSLLVGFGLISVLGRKQKIVVKIRK